MNKLKWFTHDHDAHEDISLRTAVRKHGHVAGWVWWCSLELLHKHGIGDTLSMPLIDMAASMMVDKRTCVGVYETLCEVGLITSASYKQEVCTICTIVIEKFRERQSKLKIKIPPTLREHSANTPLEREREREEERERQTYSGRLFVPPTVDEVTAYCLERNNGISPSAFVDHYQARGWIPKGYTRQMKDWKAAVRTWEPRNKPKAVPSRPVLSDSDKTAIRSKAFMVATQEQGKTTDEARKVAEEAVKAAEIARGAF